MKEIRFLVRGCLLFYNESVFINFIMLTYVKNRLDSDNSIYVHECIFIKLESIDGGAILSCVDKNHAIISNLFYSCEAKGSGQSRGGAFLIKSGSVKIKSCCVNDCKGQYGADCVVFTVRKLDWTVLSYNCSPPFKKLRAFERVFKCFQMELNSTFFHLNKNNCIAC